MRTIFLLILFSYNYLTAQVDSAQAHQRYQEARDLIKATKYEAALQKFEEAIPMYEALENWEKYISAKSNISLIYWRTGRPQESIDQSSATLRECRTKLGRGESIQEAGILENLGIAYGIKGFGFLSMRYFEQSLRLRRKILGEEHPSLAKMTHNLGIAKKNAGHYDEALDYLNTAMQLKIKHFGTDSRELISTYNVMSIVYILNHEYEHGHEYAQKALEIARKNFGEEHPQTADAYQRLGIAYHYEGNHRQALDYLHKSEKLMTAAFDAQHAYLAPIYNNIGEAYLEENDYDAALDHFEKALAITKKQYGEQNIKTISIYNNVGEVYHREGNSEEALAFFEKALELYRSVVGAQHPDLANIYNLMGQQYAEVGDYEKALRAFQQALQANIYSFSDSTVISNPTWSEELQFAQGTILISSLLHKGRTAYKYYQKNNNSKQLQNAHDALKLALLVVEATEHSYTHKKDKAILLDTEQNVYQSAIQFCLEMAKNKDQKYLEEAFAISERDKSVLLMETLHQNQAFAFGGVPDSLSLKEKNLRIDIAAHRKRLSDAKTAQDKEKIKYYEDLLFELDKEEDKLLAFLEEHYPKYHQLKYKSDIASIQEIQEIILDEETALLEYFVSDTVVYIFCIEKDQFKIESVSFKDINQTIRNFRDVLTQMSYQGKNQEADFKQFVESSYHLYEKLIAPAGLPPTIKRLIIVPDGQLNHIPFEVLVDQQETSGRSKYKDLSYLLRKYAISYSYSATLLRDALQNPIQSPNHKILAFAPDYAEEDAAKAAHRSKEIQQLRGLLEDLPGARAEVAALKNHFQGNFYINRVASEQEFREQSDQFGIIHLAMHGRLSVRNPIESGLIFAENGDSLHDNVLFAYEINNIPIKAQLVVLSACETGYGKFQDGEGVMSIARSFMYAGTHSLLMSLWTISDDATKVLMENFYANLRKGMPKDVALQQAKLQYLEQAEGAADHPFLWAGFVALGDDRPIEIQEPTGHLWWILSLAGITILLLGVWWSRRLAKKATPTTT